MKARLGWRERDRRALPLLEHEARPVDLKEKAASRRGGWNGGRGAWGGALCSLLGCRRQGRAIVLCREGRWA